MALKGMEKALKKMDEMDSFQTFGNFVAEELRKIPNVTLANKVQRKLTRYLMDCLDEVDATQQELITINNNNQSNSTTVNSWLLSLNCNDSIVQNIL